MIISFKNAIYVQSPEGCVRCVLHVNSEGCYYLVPTKGVVEKITEGYQVLTWAELIAQFGPMAVQDGSEEPKRRRREE